MRTDQRAVEVLLIEDNPGDVMLTQEALDDAGITTLLTAVGDGITALDVLRRRVADHERLPDLVLLDLNLPGLNGHEVLARIRADEHLEHLPVVIMTTSDAEADVLRAYRGAASSYVVKPLDPTEFVKAVHGVDSFWLGVAQIPGTFER